MTDCNYLYIVALFSFWIAFLFWGWFLMGVLVNGFLGSACQWLWDCIVRWTRADRNPERNGYVAAVRDMLLYVMCPIVIIIAGYLVYWDYHSDNRSYQGLAEGRKGGDRASAWGVGLRWVPDEHAPCWMMEREACAGLWNNVSRRHIGCSSEHDRNPISFSTSFAIKEFVRNMERRHPVRGWSWGVPTEYQWRTACLAGGNGPSNQEKLLQGWLRENSNRHAHAIGMRTANAWGLLDMIGNVVEACRGDAGLQLFGGDYNSSADEGLNTGCCYEDEDDAYLWPMRYDEDQNINDVGLRLCLNPTPLAKAYQGSTFIVEQTQNVIAYSNYILIYGALFLVIEILIAIYRTRLKQTRWAWLARWSVFDDWRDLFSGSVCKRIKVALKIIVKYVIGWVVGLFFVSPLALLMTVLIPSIPDPEFSIPEAISVAVVGFILVPLVLTAFAACGMIKSVLLEWQLASRLAVVQRCYMVGFLPMAMLFSIMTIRDYARPFWRELTGRDAQAVRVATCSVSSESSESDVAQEVLWKK